LLKNLKLKKVKNPENGIFELTTEKRTKFSFWAVLTLIDKFEQSK